MNFLDRLLGWVKRHTTGKTPPAKQGGSVRKGGPESLPPPVLREERQPAPRLIVPDKPRLVHSGAASRFVYEGETLKANLSSNVVSLTYSVKDQELTVEYGNGAVWAYGNFSDQEALWAYEAGSKGTFVWDLIRVRGKGGKHKHKKPARQLR